MNMSRNFVGRVLAPMVVLGLTWSNAHALLIDDFDNAPLAFPGVNATGPSGTDSTTLNDPSILGGSRTIDLQMLAGTAATVVTIIDSGIPGVAGVLDINNGTTERSNVTLSYSFTAVDFTDAGASTGLFLGLPNPIDNQMDLTVTLSSAGGSSTVMQSFPDGSSGADFFLAFGDFLGTADLTQLTAATVAITSPVVGLDTQIDLIETRPQTVPAPATTLLLGAGLLGFAVRRRRQG